MKKSIVLTAFIATFSCLNAQETDRIATAKVSNTSGDSLFTKVDVMPQFPGGETALTRYVASNYHYPSVAKKDRLEGTLYLSFIVEKDGSLSNEKIIRGIKGGEAYNSEGLRVIKSMPDWIPGTLKGEKVRVQFILPIRVTY